MKEFLTLFFLLSTFFCVSGQAIIDTSEYIVLQKEGNRNPWTDDKKVKSATLSENEIIQIEKLLTECINEYNHLRKITFTKDKKSHPEHNSKLEDYIIDLPKYRRQFIPVLNLKGEKEVWVNCFRANSQEFSYWRKKVVFVFDGGHYFFQLRINLATNKFYAFGTNGVG